MGDGPMLAEVAQYISMLKDVEYAIIKPTWFMEQFSEMGHARTIREEGRIYSATGEGKVPFIAGEDVARVAWRCLVDEERGGEYLVVGRELWSFDQVSNSKLSWRD